MLPCWSEDVGQLLRNRDQSRLPQRTVAPSNRILSAKCWLNLRRVPRRVCSSSSSRREMTTKIRPILLAEDGEYLEGFWRARRGELRDREAELPGVRSLLFNGPASLHLHTEGSRQVVGDQKVITDIDLGHRDLPLASQELRGDGVFTGLADVEVVLLHYTPSRVELGKALRWVQELEVAHLVKLLASKPGQDFCNHPP